MPDSDILIAGGGPAGLTTAGALKQVGLDSVILDSGDRIGQSWEQRYDRLHLHTVRAYSGLAHFPIPRTYPKYPSKDLYARYLREYAGHFSLNFIPNQLIKRVRQGRVGARPGWEVETEAETWLARVVVIATGQFGKPAYPEFPGLSQYGGEIMHSSKFRSGSAYWGQQVLVIGAGNSGMEIAADLVEQGASKVILSIRSGPPVVPRDFLGVPAQVFGIWMNSFPPATSDRVGHALSRLALGDLTRYGLPAPQWMPFSSHRTPVIDVGFVSALKAGKVRIQPDVRSFTPTGAIFHDYQVETFDSVIFATGFHSGLNQLLEPEGLLDPKGNPRFSSGSLTNCPGLYFMGYFDSLRGFLFESNLASKRLAKEIKARLSS